MKAMRMSRKRQRERPASRKQSPNECGVCVCVFFFFFFFLLLLLFFFRGYRFTWNQYAKPPQHRGYPYFDIMCMVSLGEWKVL